MQIDCARKVLHTFEDIKIEQHNPLWGTEEVLQEGVRKKACRWNRCCFYALSNAEEDQLSTVLYSMVHFANNELIKKYIPFAEIESVNSSSLQYFILYYFILDIGSVGHLD